MDEETNMDSVNSITDIYITNNTINNISWAWQCGTTGIALGEQIGQSGGQD